MANMVENVELKGYQKPEVIVSNLQVQDVTEADVETFNRVYRAVFTNPEEDYGVKYFKECVQDEGKHIDGNDTHFFLFYSDPKADDPQKDVQPKPIGFRWLVYRQDSHVGYVPDGGLIDGYKDNHIYPWGIQETEPYMLEKGLNTVLIDCENPAKLEGKDAENAIRRLRFFQRNGYEYVQLPLHRPGTTNDFEANKTIDDTLYIFGFKTLAEGGPQVVERDDGQEIKKFIKKDDLKKIYFEYLKMETDEEDEAVIRSTYTACAQFMNGLDQLDDLIPLYDPIPPGEIDSSKFTQ